MSDPHETFEALVQEALKNEGLKYCEVKVRGGNEKGEGYIGDITFVDVFAKKIDGSEAEYSLVLKFGGKNKTMRSIVRLGFEREIHIYSKVIPAFWSLQEEFGLSPFTAIPKCYFTLLTETQEVLVLQNMKAQGFKLYDRKTVMNLNHVKLVLKVLGQWHALSFALKLRKSNVFEKLTCNWKCPATEVYVNSHVGKWMNMAQEHLLYVLKESGELELLERYKKKTKNKLATSIIKDIFSMEEQQVVITHGDCWNNNLMFKYEDKNDAVPSEVVILDFQISNISSPVIDLSYFIYAVSAEQELHHFDELLRTYHQSLSEALARMQCDPEEVFPFCDLEKHWRKYSAYGALINPLIVCDNLVDKDDAVSYGNKNEKYESTMQSVDRKQNELFWSRLIAVAKHFTYCEL